MNVYGWIYNLLSKQETKRCLIWFINREVMKTFKEKKEEEKKKIIDLVI